MFSCRVSQKIAMCIFSLSSNLILLGNVYFVKVDYVNEHVGVTCVTGVADLTGVKGETCVTGVPGVTYVTGVTFVTGVTCVTGATVVTACQLL